MVGRLMPAPVKKVFAKWGASRLGAAEVVAADAHPDRGARRDIALAGYTCEAESSSSRVGLSASEDHIRSPAWLSHPDRGSSSEVASSRVIRRSRWRVLV